MKWYVSFMVACIAPSVANAAEGDETLKLLLSKTKLVVVGTLTGNCRGISHEAGVVDYICKIKVTEVLKGEKLKADNIRIRIVRYELGRDDSLPYLKKGVKCVFFLSPDPNANPKWKSSDPWIGVLPYNSQMVNAIKRLLKEFVHHKDKPHEQKISLAGQASLADASGLWRPMRRRLSFHDSAR